MTHETEKYLKSILDDEQYDEVSSIIYKLEDRIEYLESQVNDLETRNDELETENAGLKDAIDELEEQVTK